MPTHITRISLTGTKEEVSPARRMVVETVRAWGVPLDDEKAAAIRLIASELITNAVVHAKGPAAIWLYHQPGRLVIEVADHNPQAPTVGHAEDEDENGRGMELVCLLAERSGWEPTENGKRVWAEIVVPKPTPSTRATILRRFFTARPDARITAEPRSLAVAVA